MLFNLFGWSTVRSALAQPVGEPATAVQLAQPWGVAVGRDGSIYIADTNNHVVRRVTPDGLSTTFAGTGVGGLSGDGALAVDAQLQSPHGLALGPDGSLYIADTGNHRIRRVGPEGVIVTIAGMGVSGFGGDNGPAASALLATPQGVMVDPQGRLYVADTGNHRIRHLTTYGIITTIAGNGTEGSNGDEGLATAAQLASPRAIALGVEGNLYIADAANQRIRQMGKDGRISTIAGTSTLPSAPEHAPARATPLGFPTGVAVGPDSNVYVVEAGGHRVRRLTTPLPGFSVDEITVASDDGRERYVFSSSGRHLRTEDTLTGAKRYEFFYTNGRLAQVKDVNGNFTTIERDASGKPLAIVAPFGQRTTLRLDANGYLDRVTNPAGEFTTFTYTPAGLMTTMTDARQHTYQFTYDPAGAGRLSKDQDPAGGFTTLSRAGVPADYTVEKTTALNRMTQYHVERLATGGTRRTVTVPDGTQSVTENGLDGTVTTTRANGTVTVTQQGPDPRFGMPAAVPTTTITTTPSALTSATTTQRDVTFDETQTPPVLATQTETTDINGRSYSSVYDAATRTMTDTSPEGRQSTTTLDARSRVLQRAVTGLAPTTFTYHDLNPTPPPAGANGKLKTISQGMRTSTFAYTAQGYLASIIDPAARTVSFTYDAAGRVTKQTLPDLREIHYTYDANGNVTSVTPPGRPDHGSTYTTVNLEDQYLPPAISGGGVTTYTYNADRQLTNILRPDNQQILLNYDSAGRLSSRALPNGTITYGYHPTTGNLTSVTAPGNSTLTYSYDGSLLTGTTWTGVVAGSVSRTYDENFRGASQSVNGGQTVSFQYDQDSLLTGAGDLLLSRDPQNGLLTGTTLGNVSDSVTYNTLGEPTHYTATSTGNAVLDVQYTRDTLGRITQKTETVGGVTNTYAYSYDTAGRLITVQKNGTTVSTYTYDPNSNRLTKTTSGGTTTGVYDAQDRLLSYGGATYASTANGELQSKTIGGQTTTYTYDVLGNLLHVSLPDGTQLDYVVDGQNRRVGKKVNGMLQQGFLYQDQLEPVAELNGDGSLRAQFVYCGCGKSVPEYMVKKGETYRIISDHLGSPRLVVKVSDSTITQRMDYDEFGNVILDTFPGFQPFGFAGGLYDQHTKLTRFGARDYDAETGRWTAKDLIRFSGFDSNLYGYVFNNPVNSIDQSGKGPIAVALCLFAAAVDITQVLSTLEGLSSELDMIKKQIKEIQNSPCKDEARKLDEIEPLLERGRRIAQARAWAIEKGIIQGLPIAYFCQYAAALPF